MDNRRAHRVVFHGPPNRGNSTLPEAAVTRTSVGTRFNSHGNSEAESFFEIAARHGLPGDSKKREEPTSDRIHNRERRRVMARAPRRERSRLARLFAHAQLPLFRNAYALIISAASTSGLGFIFWVVAARYYTPETVGLNSAAISAMMLIAGLAQFNLRAAMIRFIPSTGRATVRLVAYSYFLTLIAAACICAFFVSQLNAWGSALDFLGSRPLSTLWFTAAAMSWAIFSLQDKVLIGLRQASWLPIENFLFASAKIALLVFFSQRAIDRGIFSSWTIPIVAVIIPVNMLIFGRLIPRHVYATQYSAVPVSVSQIAWYVSGDYVGTLFSLGANMLIPLVVARRIGAEATAYFYQPWLIAASLELIVAGFATSLTVEASSDYASLAEYTRRILRQSAALVTPVVAVLISVAGHLLRVFGKDYAVEGTSLLRLLALATLPDIVIVVCISVIRVQRRVKYLGLIQGVLCMSLLIISYILLPIYGIIGVGWALLTSQTAVAMVLFLLVLRPVLWPTNASPRILIE